MYLRVKEIFSRVFLRKQVNQVEIEEQNNEGIRRRLRDLTVEDQMRASKEREKAKKVAKKAEKGIAKHADERVEYNRDDER